MEQELPWSTTFQVGYVGERGTHLYGNTNLNPYVNDTESLDRVSRRAALSLSATTRATPSMPAFGRNWITSSTTTSCSAPLTRWAARSTTCQRSSPPTTSPRTSSAVTRRPVEQPIGVRLDMTTGSAWP